jgi:diacylglycerol kinase family enzyme
MSHIQFASMIGSYKNGTYLEKPKIMKKVTYHKCKSVFIDFECEQSVCVDGEISKLKELKIEIVPACLKFSVPAGIACEVTEVEKKELLEV